MRCRSVEETRRLGEKLAETLVSGDVVALVGDLGAGKTAFVQGLARGLGVAEKVQSPSFTIVNEHRGRLPLFHVDFYRLEDERELDEIGFGEYLSRDGVVVVEWADKFPAALPRPRLTVRIEIAAPGERDIVFDEERA